MVRIENDCVGCEIPCINCGRKHTPHYYCDECDDETDIYYFDGDELCIRCVTKRLTKVGD